MNKLYFLLLLLFLVACGDSSTTSKNTISEPKTVSAETLAAADTIPQYLQTKVNSLRVRVAPNTAAKDNWVIAMLAENSYWKYTGKKTDFKEQITLRDSAYNEPWYQIELDSNLVGWVYGGAVDFVPKQLKKIAPNYNFPVTLGKYLTANQIRDFVQVKIAYDFVSDAKTLIDIYRNQIPKLQKYVRQGMLKSHPDAIYSGDNRPIELWKELDNYLSLFTTTLLCGECDANAYQNHKKLLLQAENTTNTVDDDFFKLLLAMEGELDEGVQHLYILDMCDVCSFSILGDGKFLKIAETVADFEKQQATAIAELDLAYIIDRAKSMASSNISSNNYWYSKKVIFEELAEIKSIIKTANWGEKYSSALIKTEQKLIADKDIQFGCKSGKCKPPN